MYSVFQHWGRLRVCVVGRSYPPEFYSFIKNPKLRSYFERIAIETEEDYQNLLNVLHGFGIETVRPNVPDIFPENYYENGYRIPGPISMIPRDQVIMIGNKFFIFPYNWIAKKASGRIKNIDVDDGFNNMDNFSLNTGKLVNWWKPVIDKVREGGNEIYNYTESDPRLSKMLSDINVNGITRIGKDLIFGSKGDVDERTLFASKWIVQHYLKEFDFRPNYITTDGHCDGCFTPVKPGLVISAEDMDGYEKTFPDWEIVKTKRFPVPVNDWYDIKRKNRGTWWINGASSDDQLIDFVETWLKDWVGNIDETYFDINSLVIDEKNILVTGYNKETFAAFERHGVTPHIVPLRHRYFWDGALSCVTAEIHRDGEMVDYFPQFGN